MPECGNNKIRFQNMEMFDLEDFKYNFVNLTTFRMVDIEDVGVREVLNHMEKYSSDKNQTVDKFLLTQVCEIVRFLFNFVNVIMKLF